MLGEQYDITVITDPPSGPFLTGNRISFTCHVYPMPSEPVTYSWHAMKDAGGPTTLTGQHTTHYTPHYRNLHFSWFFCKVFSNESLVGVGRRLVEIHGKTQAQTHNHNIVACSTIFSYANLFIVGFVFSVKPLFRTFILGSTIELQVNVSTDYLASHIETLTWYHNETEIPSLRWPRRAMSITNFNISNYQF